MAVRWCGVVFCLGVVVGWLLGAGLGLKAADEPSPAEKKLQERVEVLEEIVKLHLAEYQAAKATLLPVLFARRDVVQAKLELATDARQRIDLLQMQVDLSKQVEEIAQALATRAIPEFPEPPKAPRLDALRAKAQRLQAEAALAEEQARASAAKK